MTTPMRPPHQVVPAGTVKGKQFGAAIQPVVDLYHHLCRGREREPAEVGLKQAALLAYKGMKRFLLDVESGLQGNVTAEINLLQQVHGLIERRSILQLPQDLSVVVITRFGDDALSHSATHGAIWLIGVCAIRKAAIQAQRRNLGIVLCQLGLAQPA